MHGYAWARSYPVVIAAALGMLGCAWAMVGPAWLFAAGLAAFVFASPISRMIDTGLKRLIFSRKVADLKLDLLELADPSMLPDKDLYFFLRPFELADAIRFPNIFDESGGGDISFEEALSRTLDKPGERLAFCVGDGRESWGVARVVFDNERWMRDIVPLFRRAAVIVSLPGRTSGCLNESYLIRTTPELCRKTVFVLPPLSCYRPPAGKERVDIAAFFRDVVARHREVAGLHLPTARADEGLFVTIDPVSGHVREQMSWQELRVHRRHRAASGALSSSAVDVSPVLGPQRIAAAIGMIGSERAGAR